MKKSILVGIVALLSSTQAFASRQSAKVVRAGTTGDGTVIIALETYFPGCDTNQFTIAAGSAAKAALAVAMGASASGKKVNVSLNECVFTSDSNSFIYLAGDE